MQITQNLSESIIDWVVDMRITFSWNNPVSAISSRIIDNDALLFMANECRRFMNDYVPANNSDLAQNVRTYVENGTGIVEYASPYAHYQWEGTLWVDPKLKCGGFFIEGVGWRSRKEVVKKKTDKKLKYSTSKHALATSHWEKAMWVARKDDVTRAVQNYINR